MTMASAAAVGWAGPRDTLLPTREPAPPPLRPSARAGGGGGARSVEPGWGVTVTGCPQPAPQPGKPAEALASAPGRGGTRSPWFQPRTGRIL